MLKLIGFIISVFLIVIIFLRMPQENVGLASFATKVTYGFSQFSATFFKYFNYFGILIYFGIAVQLNLINV
jgi:hypothetical protein